jgi:AcrR family transcriptional regulator
VTTETRALPLQDPEKLQTKYRLLEVAARHIALHGFKGASLRRIAADAGVSAAAIYRHYPGGKLDLYESTLAMVSNAVTAFIQGGQEWETNLADQLVTQCDLFWQFFAEYPNVAAMIVRENISGGPQGPSPYFEQHVLVIESQRQFLNHAIEKKAIRPINVSAFLFWVATYVTNFHGCQALRDATWSPQDLTQAKAEFLAQVRKRLGASNASSSTLSESDPSHE